LPHELVESELFGYARGAHSQASQSKIGVIEEANGGTLFLDEIGDMPHTAQAKLLRFLQSREVIPLGSTRPRPVSVRVIAATSRPGGGNGSPGLREDLVGRMGAAALSLPPLRARKEDLGVLIHHFLTEGRRKPARPLDAALFLALCLHPWPRNVRELKKVIETAGLLSEDHPEIGIAHVPEDIARHVGPAAPQVSPFGANRSLLHTPVPPVPFVGRPDPEAPTPSHVPGYPEISQPGWNPAGQDGAAPPQGHVSDAPLRGLPPGANMPPPGPSVYNAPHGHGPYGNTPYSGQPNTMAPTPSTQTALPAYPSSWNPHSHPGPQKRRSPRPIPPKDVLETLLEKHNGRIADVARELDRHWKVIKRAVVRLGIDVENYKSADGDSDGASDSFSDGRQEDGSESDSES
jgi:DNA-binding NtrC family response regulator